MKINRLSRVGITLASLFLATTGALRAGNNPLRWDDVLGLTVIVQDSKNCGGGSDAPQTVTSSAKVTGGERGCPQKLAITVVGSVETQNAPFDYVYLNGELLFSGDEAQGGCGGMTTKTATRIIEVDSGDEITLTYDTSDALYHTGAFATIVSVQPVSEDCSTCAPGSGSANNGSVHVTLSMGNAEYGSSIGAIRIDEAIPTADLGTPAALRYGGGWEGVEIIRDGSEHLRQVKTPQVLADVVTETATRYRVDFYASNEIGPLSSGLYDQSGKTPYVSWVMENLAPSTNGHFKATEVIGSTSRENEFIWNPIAQNWTLITGNGLRKETKSSVVDALAGTLTVTETIEDGASNVSSKTVKTYKDYAWGRELIQTVVDPDGAAITTDYTFYDDNLVDGGAYTKLKSIVHSDGGWSRYEYDSEGRLIKIVEPYLDAPPGSPEGSCKVTTTVYGSYPQETRIVTILGQEVERRYTSRSDDWSHQTQEIVCTVPGASYYDSSNLVTIRTLIGTGPFTGEVARVDYPDGTGETYSYSISSGNKVTVARKGASGGGYVSGGTETTTVVDVAGNLVSETEKDISSGIILSSKTVTTRDFLGRPTLITYSDGSTEEFEYGCCGIEREKDRKGSVTLTTYDALKRVLTQSKNGITTIYSYDASNRVLTTTRRGADASDIVLETLTYDLADRITSRKNALNHTTTYSEAINGSSQKVLTTTLPDSSTQIETIHRDGQLKEAIGSAIHPRKFEYGVSVAGGLRYTKEIRIGEGASETEWIKSYTDPAGRAVTVEYPDSAEETSHYNTLGQLVKQIDADGVTRLFSYDSQGNLSEQAVDLDQSNSINSADRRQKSLHSVVAGPLIQTVTQEGTASGYIGTSTVEVSPNGRYQKVTRHGLDTTSQVTHDGLGGSITTVTHPDGSTSITESQHGRVTSSIRKANGGTTIASVEQEYDAHGRLIRKTDQYTNIDTLYTYNNGDQITSVDTGGLITSYSYNNLGQLVTETLPGSGRTISRTYQPTGELLSETGSATYPISYTYDPQGRRRTMTTSSGATTWSYDSARGWLTSKADAQSGVAGYIYTPAARPRTRTWARGITTTYSYDSGGEVSSISYSDGTPGVTFTRDTQGRLIEITDASGTRTLSHTSAGQVEEEALTGGLLAGTSIETTYDPLLRKTNFAASKNNTSLISISTSYDAASRPSVISSGNQSAIYNYLAGSSHVSQITHSQSGTPAMTTTKSYDGLKRLISISSAPSIGTPVSYGYQYNSAGQRDQITLQGGDTWNYGYNSRGEVTSGAKKLGGSTNINGYQFGYAYDNLGNRTSSTRSARTSNYSTNSLNQYTSRSVPGYVDIIGEAKAGATVTVNNDPATRQGVHYYKELEGDNSTEPRWLSAQVKAVLGTDEAVRSGHLYLPKTPEAYSYDQDGNMLSDGRWTYQWDGENRLIGMETQLNAVLVGAPRQRLTFGYDYQSRRISKKVEDWKGGHYQERFTMLFVYDGWNLVAEYLKSGPLIRTYVWGIDLSGGTAAGGIGGLLFINQYPENKTYSVGYDGNGNIMALFDMGAGGEIAASYEYGPFGEPIQVNGAVASINPFRFSTKYVDGESGLIHYGHRFYIPTIGRWLNADPAGEEGGLNLYAYVENGPSYKVDFLGLWSVSFEGNGWTPATKSYFNQRMAAVESGIGPMISRTDRIISQAEKMSDCCPWKKQIISDLKGWRQSLLRPMQQRLGNKSLILPVKLEVLAEGVDGHGAFILPKLLGSELYNFRFLAFNSLSFFINPIEANKTIFHELSHISGTLDSNSDDPVSALWNAHIIEDYFAKAASFVPDYYFSLLKVKLGAKGCSEKDKKWPNN